jgi:hypothetical protein
MGSTASGWDNNCIAGEHMLITSLFFNNVIKMMDFLQNFCGWMRIPNALILDNFEFTVRCCIGNMHYNVCLVTGNFVFLN